MLLRFAKSLLLSALLAPSFTLLACGDEDPVDEDCFRTFEEVCPVPALARSSIDLECGETLQSIEGGTRDGDFCCYEVTITRGYCPDPY